MSTSSDTSPRTSQPTPPPPVMSSTPLQPLSLEVALEMHGQDRIPTLQPPRQQIRTSSLSPAHCRLPKKILGDVRGLLSASLPYTGEEESLLDVVGRDERSSDSENEEGYEQGDEASEGYLDEDDNMELSDAAEHDYDNAEDGIEEEEDASIVGDTKQFNSTVGDGDTIEDIMDLPGHTTPPAPPPDFSSLYAHNQPTPNEIKEIKLRHATLKKALQDERLGQERRNPTAVEHDTLGLGVATDGQDDAVHLSDDSEFQTVQAVQAEIGMSIVEDDEAASELELIEAYDRRASRRFSPKPISRRASEDALLPSSSSFINFLDYEPAVVQTPGGQHIDFAPTAAIPDTPFASILDCFQQQYIGKRNSPFKSRRNASLPEEIAALTREAQEEEPKEEKEELEKYREMDLAPMEPVMAGDNAGDLITIAPPSESARATTFDLLDRSLFMIGDNSFSGPKMTSSAEAVAQGAQQSPQHTTSPSHLTLPLEQDRKDADAESSDTVSKHEQKQPIIYSQQPTFVTIIGMLPIALFWATVAPVAKLGNKVYDTLIKKLTGLKV